MTPQHRPCPFGDPYCPCQDGDACHYVDYPWSKAMTPPDNANTPEYRAMVEARALFLEMWRWWVEQRPGMALVEHEHRATARAVAGIVVTGG